MKKISTFAILVLFPCLLLAQTPGANNKEKLVWSDEFNYNGSPDSTKWGYEEGFIRNQILPCKYYIGYVRGVSIVAIYKKVSKYIYTWHTQLLERSKFY